MKIDSASNIQIGAEISKKDVARTDLPNKSVDGISPSTFQQEFEKIQGQKQTPIQNQKPPILGLNTQVGGPPNLKFSNHAVERMKDRGIFFHPEEIGRLNNVVQKAAAKGAKEALILMNDNALIVSVKNNTVVTVMDKNALKENVFTNIDSTVII